MGISPSLDLQGHHLSVALLQPQIAPNTGNIARLCVATGCDLHLVRPLGFVLDDRQLRRSAMDYWPRLKYTIHDDTAQFFSSLSQRRFWIFDSAGQKSHFSADFRDEDVLIFGSETKGVDSHILSVNSLRTLRIPQVNSERCLNLSTSVGIVVYEAIRQLQFMDK
jgi:tRNA (cytidine/uridine-2'-O-)-methyltransferase